MSENGDEHPHLPPWARKGPGKIAGYIAFFALFFGALFLFNLYVLTRLFSMLGWKHGMIFLLFTILSPLSFVAAMAIRGATSCIWTKAYYFSAATWLGFLIYMLFASIFFDIAGWFIDFDSKAVAPAFIAGTALLVVISMAVPLFIVKHELEIPAPKLNRDVKILHVSDIHVGAAHGPERLRKIVDMSNAMRPDVVLITGDLADSPMRPDDAPFAALNGLESPTFFVVGNHEHYAGIEDVALMLAQTKVRVLRNEAVTFGEMQIVGLDFGGAKDVASGLTRLKLDRSKFIVLMFHQPDGLDEARTAGVDLMLCGHTHGGQFFPFTVINRLIWGKEYYGLHRREEMWVHTSAGAGTWGPPMRLGTRSEVTQITLKSGK